MERRSNLSTASFDNEQNAGATTGLASFGRDKVRSIRRRSIGNKQQNDRLTDDAAGEQQDHYS